MGYEFLANCALLSPLKKKKKELTSLTNVDIPIQRRGPRFYIRTRYELSINGVVYIYIKLSYE